MNRLLQVRCPGVCFYVLRDNDELYLIDSGFVGGFKLLERALKRRGWSQLPIRGILLTHGHLDHIHNVHAIVAESGCWVAAHPLDQAHCEGTYPYRHQAMVCGYLEHAGRAIFGSHPFKIDRWFEDGDSLPICGGLNVIHLPGHTDGHCGFLSPSRNLLFAGDLFASHLIGSHRPPKILNTQPDLIASSIRKALSLKPDGVAPSHCDRASFAEHLKRLQQLPIEV